MHFVAPSPVDGNPLTGIAFPQDAASTNHQARLWHSKEDSGLKGKILCFPGRGKNQTGITARGKNGWIHHCWHPHQSDHVKQNSLQQEEDDEKQEENHLCRHMQPNFFSSSPEKRRANQFTLAYHGVPGANTETAAMKALPHCLTLPFEHVELACEAVDRSIADAIILPVENSMGGSVQHNYDVLLRQKFHIIGEVYIPIHHCLLTVAGVKNENITRVISHTQALSQCEQTLKKMGLSFMVEVAKNTAMAAKHVATNNIRNTAVIASARAAKIYGLHVLADGIQDDRDNVTRFVMLAREPVSPLHTPDHHPYKTSIVFSQTKGTETLCKILSAFAHQNISVTKIESRPHRARPLCQSTVKQFEYFFYVDFAASLEENRSQNALAEVRDYISFLRILGSYPMDTMPWRTSNAGVEAEKEDIKIRLDKNYQA